MANRRYLPSHRYRSSARSLPQSILNEKNFRIPSVRRCNHSTGSNISPYSVITMTESTWSSCARANDLCGQIKTREPFLQLEVGRSAAQLLEHGKLHSSPYS